MQKTLIWIGSVIGAAAVLALAYTYLIHPREQRSIAVSGECLTTAPKDRTAITLRVTTLDKNAAASMKKATEQIAQITEFLKSQDVKMQTTQFNSYEKTEWDHQNQKSVTLGIETTIAVEVSADNIEKIEAVLNKFAGVPNVYSENIRMFTSAETIKPILEKCLGTAIENARERATAIAIADGAKLGELVSAGYGTSVNNTYSAPTANFMRTKLEVASMDMAVGGGLVSKDTELSVTVSAVFEVR